MTPLVDLSQDIHELTPGLIALRRALHQHPELAFEEAWTAATLAGRMRALGLAVREGIDGTGVLAMLDGAQPGKTLLIRADIDALPMEDATGKAYAYFKDPDGHPLEVLWFPSGKGDARWHRPTDRLFLGIDHTAIVVANTALSLTCYRDTLGLRVAGTSENYGPEQERLNNVFGARLRITTLRAPSGPGVEFLEHLTPRDGRPVPADTRPNDLVHWQTTLASDDAEAVARAVRGSRCAMLSSGVVAPAERALGFAKGFLVRDPDGHTLKVVQP